MARKQRLSLEDVCEGLLAITLVDAEPGTFVIVGIQEHGSGEYVRCEEDEDEAEARAIAKACRTDGTAPTPARPGQTAWRPLDTLVQAARLQHRRSLVTPVLPHVASGHAHERQ
jgi:hypothetical protein